VKGKRVTWSKTVRRKEQRGGIYTVRQNYCQKCHGSSLQRSWNLCATFWELWIPRRLTDALNYFLVVYYS